MSDPVVESMGLCLRAGLAPMLWGPPGVGKSDRVKDLAKERGWGLVDVRLARRSPVDLRGVPVPDTAAGRTRYLPPFEFPEPKRDGREGIWFLDEVTGAPPAVQAAALQLFLERKFDSYEVPPGWHVVAAGNRVTDRSGSYAMLASLANRVVHLPVWCDLPALDVSPEGVRPDADAWRAWAYSTGRVREEVVAFIAFRPDLVWKPTGQVAFPTPRTWEFVSRLLDASGGSAPPSLAVAGCVGTGPAGEFLGFLRVRREMPDPDAILAGADVPAPPADRPDVAWALGGALVSRLAALKKKRKPVGAQVAAFVRWLPRLPSNFQVLYLKEAWNAGLGTECAAQPGFLDFAREHREVFVDEIRARAG